VSGAIIPADFVSSLPATRADLEYLSEQRKMLREFVSKELIRDSDFGVIPGTKKATLYKPGAEKLKVLFKLGFNTVLTRETINAKENFAMFTYKTQVYRLDDQSMIVGECEASCNSQEKKYRERSVWINNQRHMEATPIFDIMNTLQKMAQKRAFVGAIIISVGASDFFTQDIDDPDDGKQLGTVPQTNAEPAAVPRATNAHSVNDAQTGSPVCPGCGQPMGISKFVNKNTGLQDHYCFKCKITREKKA